MKQEKKKVLDALNRIDKLADEGIGGNYSEAEQLEKDYNLVFDFIISEEK